MEATAELLLALKKATPGLRLSLGVSTFVPKAHTPFQWQGVRPEAEKRLKLLGKRLKPKGIQLRPESYGWSVIQALLSRSDRRLAPVIAAARGTMNRLGAGRRPTARESIYPPGRRWCMPTGSPAGCCPGSTWKGPCPKAPWPNIKRMR